MNVIGIVVEYNPFHNGHLYQIKKIKKMYPDSIIVVAMSGNFTQRGEISIINKWDKTRIALKYGIDVVLEIPFVFSNQSADTFSYAAVKMLYEFGIDTLVFGSESADLELLTTNARVQLNNKEFDKLVKSYMDKGNNYPTSLSHAIYKLTGSKITSSNDLLAVSYIKEILKNNYEINIVPIKRTNSFLDTSSDEKIVSALNIREKIRSDYDISKYVPEFTLKFVKGYDKDKLFNILKYKIISDKNIIKYYHLVDEGIDNRIYEVVLKSDNYDDFVFKVKTKRITYNKINRILINILTSFTKEEALSNRHLEYIKVLGFSKEGQRYYKMIKKNFTIPIITKFEDYSIQNIERRVSLIYNMITNSNEDEIKNHVIID